jgi:hypothetical protein
MNPATQVPRRSGRRRGAQILSTILFLAAIGFAAAAVYLWYTNEEAPDVSRPTPTVTPGFYTLSGVLDAFTSAGLDGDYGRSPATVKSNQMDPPGQHLVIEDRSVYIFIFSGGAGERAEAAQDLDPATMTLTTPSGRSFSEGETLTIAQGSNVIAVLVGGDEELQAEVQRVIEGLR